jgi:hypothetical protein
MAKSDAELGPPAENAIHLCVDMQQMWLPCAQDPEDVADAVKRSRAGQMVAFGDRILVLQDRLALRL